MTRRHLYLLLALVGFVVPYYFFISFLMTHGLNLRLFVAQLFATQISTFFATDFLIACVVFGRFMSQEADLHAMKHQWIYWLSLFTVGLSFALPLFLWARESYLSAAPAEAVSRH